MSVRTFSQSIEEVGEKKSRYERLAYKLYKWIEKHGMVPVVNAKVKNVVLRKGYGFLRGHIVSFLEAAGTRATYRFEPTGDFSESLHARVTKGLVVLYNDEPDGNNSAVIVYG